MRIIAHNHVLAVRDVRASAGFYVDRLGFALAADHGDWIFVSRDGCTIMLGECPDDLPAGELGCHSYVAYFRVDDAAAFHEELRGRGVTTLGNLEDKPWGMREFGVTTPDGHRFTIGQQMPAAGPFAP